MSVLIEKVESVNPDSKKVLYCIQVSHADGSNPALLHPPAKNGWDTKEERDEMFDKFNKTLAAYINQKTGVKE